MVLKMFCLYDVKVLIYHPPVFCHNEGHALRVMWQICSQERTQPRLFPDDFSVYEVGCWDDQSGVVVSIVPGPRFVCGVSDLFRQMLPPVPVSGAEV